MNNEKFNQAVKSVRQNLTNESSKLAGLKFNSEGDEQDQLGIAEKLVDQARQILFDLEV